MRLNTEAFEKLFYKEFNGNYHEAARQLEADSSQIHRIIHGKQGAGILFIERIFEWCSKNKYDYTELIFLPEVLTSAKSNNGKKQKEKIS